MALNLKNIPKRMVRRTNRLLAVDDPRFSPGPHWSDEVKFFRTFIIDQNLNMSAIAEKFNVHRNHLGNVLSGNLKMSKKIARQLRNLCVAETEYTAYLPDKNRGEL